jgi:transposase InsO family protein
MKTIAETLGISRSNLNERPKGRAGYKKIEDEILIPLIRAICDARPTYGYRRVTAVLNRGRAQRSEPPINHKRVYRMMKLHHLLLCRQTGKPVRSHTGKIVTKQSNQRWCSDAFEIACWNSERVRVAFSLDTCDREAISHLGTTAGISAEMIEDLIADSVASRFGLVDQVPHAIEWLTDNGPPYTAISTRRFAAALGLRICTTPVRSPQSNGMAEAFVKTFKRDYVHVSRLDNAQVVLEQLPKWFEDYNNHHPHKGLKMMSPREYKQSLTTTSLCPV